MATTPNLGLTKIEVGQHQKEATINANYDILDAQLGGSPTLTFIGCRVYGSANQSINTATATALSFNTERFDTDTIHDTGTNPTRLTCKTAGTYSIKGAAGFAANATGWRGLYVRLNGTTFLAAQRANNVGAADVTYMTTSTDYVLAVNDYVEILAEQTSGGALNVLAVANFSYEAMMHLVR